MGDEEHLKSKGVDVVVLNDQTCIDIMDKFIKVKPTLWNEDIGV